jgi:GNAT superfamily N-acetyltransferase
MHLTLRPAGATDAERVRELMLQLGYDVPADQIAQRLAGRGCEREVFVAENEAGVVAWAGVCIRDDFIGGRYAEIEGFVVDATTRGAGIGARLLDAVEAWARSQHCDTLRVRSNVIRDRAHTFYERHGYSKVKAQFSFRKPL